MATIQERVLAHAERAASNADAAVRAEARGDEHLAVVRMAACAQADAAAAQALLAAAYAGEADPF